MHRDSAFDSKEENTDIVKRKESAEGMDEVNPRDGTSPTVKSKESYSASPAAVTAGIIIAIGIGLFTVCAAVFWILKQQMAQKKSPDDKCVLLEKDDQKTAAPENENEKTKCQINKTEEIMDNVPVNDKNAKNKCHIKYSKQESDKGIQNSLSVNEDCLLSVKSTADITGHDCHDGEQICTDGPAEKQQCTTTNAEDAKDNSMIKENQLVGFKSNEDILNCGVLIELESLTPGTLGKEASTSMEISTITEINNFEESKNLQHMEATVDDGADLVKEGPSFSGEISIIAPKTDKCDNLKSTEITGDMKVQENLSPCTKVNEYADERIHKVKPSNSNCKGIQSGETESKEGVKSGALEPVCPSMQNIKELNKPKEVTGRLSMPKEASLFQLDDHAPSVNTLQFDSDNMLRPRSLTDTNIEPKNGQKQLVKQSLSTSKSLDSQLISLKKGCELLETRPRKSSLRSRGSDGCLKKYVHFPEDIRNIQKVHKYDSFDDSICLKTDGDYTKEETGNK